MVKSSATGLIPNPANVSDMCLHDAITPAASVLAFLILVGFFIIDAHQLK